MHQLLLARHMVRQHTKASLERLGPADKVTVCIDSTQFETQEEHDFIASQFVRHGITDYDDIQMVPFRQTLPTLNTLRCFVFSFMSDNPIRQLLEGFFQATNYKDMPQIIICAPSDVDNEPADASKCSGDRNSDRVTEWLDYYRPTRVDGNAEVKKKIGEVALHLPRDMTTETPPEAFTPAGLPLKSVGTTPIASRAGSPSKGSAANISRLWPSRKFTKGLSPLYFDSANPSTREPSPMQIEYTSAPASSQGASKQKKKTSN